MHTKGVRDDAGAKLRVAMANGSSLGAGSKTGAETAIHKLSDSAHSP